MPLTATANLKNLANTADVGWATFTLVGTGGNVPRISGSVLSVLTLKAVADGSGNISTTIIGNDTITPSGTTYAVNIYSSGGALISSARYSLTGSGTVDLSTLTPLT
jgi:hypothetical protein